MITHANSLLQLNHLSDNAVVELIPSFFHLPHTDHADGAYRLRRYSMVQLCGERLLALPESDFVQSTDVNHFQGDVVRHFEPLEPETVASDGLKEMCELFLEAHELARDHVIEVHQIRIVAINEHTPVAPEGVHQDGFDHIAVIGIHRHNIEGGDFMVFRERNAQPIMALTLQDGDVAILDDHQLWHYATPITACDEREPAYMDVFVLTAKD
ncbi:MULTISPECIES: 2OG-Fe dioxygenase family protein [Aliagarivorans]|uniref:2OG-Fe dioxygenase family protein n=1 Tax=Aliagarivorans TaxID=882379 RepID=UPI0003FF0014|nr:MULTISPECIES: 2OG-Fe dioxygenase family protein [Aliagarivorans]